MGDGAIIAAKSVVSRDVEPYTIVAGNPAQPVRLRVEEDVRDRLLALQWWNWPVEKIQQASDALMKSDVSALEKIHAGP